MVQFGQIIISNEVFLLTIFIPMLFAFWYYRRVLTARDVKVLYDDTGGDSQLYPALWNITDKTVVMKRSRKERVTLKKVNPHKRVFVPPYSMQTWFRGAEGSNETQPWKDIKEGESNFDLGYEVASMEHHWLEQMRTAFGLTIKNPMVYMALLAGAGVGMAVMQVLNMVVT